MSLPATSMCRLCGKRILLCQCGAAGNRPHWIDVDHLSCLCPSGDTHAPEVPE